MSNGFVIREPAASEPGYWAGAPGAFHDREKATWYLTYRIRRPRGVAPDRGGEARIARSDDLRHWEDVWSVTKDRFSSASIERCALRRGSDGRWHYFVSYVDPADNRWCVSQITAREIGQLDAREAKPLFKAGSLGLEGVKDPWIYADHGKFYMFLSVAVPTLKTGAGSHTTGDIFNTGDCISATALATSVDLDDWNWLGLVFKPEPGRWDCYCRRINSVAPLGEKLLAFYDGSAGHHENYEEKCGFAVSRDWRGWHCRTPDGPGLTSPHASKSLRYLDAQVVGEEICLFYEFARSDGAHDLRLARVEWDSFSKSICSLVDV